MFHQSIAFDHEMADPLDEVAEWWRFQTRELWFLYENYACWADTWREQNKILIQHLRQHQDRLCPYPWCPSEAWLVSWAIKNGDPPMQEFLSWSLHEEEPREGHVTIKMLEEHLKVWADLFESPRASHFKEAVVDEDTPLFRQQQHVGAPWIAHLLVSQNLYWEWTCSHWKKLWRQHLLSKDAMEIDSMGAEPLILYSDRPQVPVSHSHPVELSVDYDQGAEAVVNYMNRRQGEWSRIVILPTPSTRSLSSIPRSVSMSNNPSMPRTSFNLSSNDSNSASTGREYAAGARSADNDFRVSTAMYRSAHISSCQCNECTFQVGGTQVSLEVTYHTLTYPFTHSVARSPS